MEEGKKDVEGWRKRGRKDKVRNEQGNERKYACKRMLILAAKAERKIAGGAGRGCGSGPANQGGGTLKSTGCRIRQT